MIRALDIILLVFKKNFKARSGDTLDLEVLFWDIKGTVPSPFKVNIENHSHIIKTDISKVVAIRSCIADDLKFWVESQSQKQGCLCATNSDRRVHGFRAACDLMSKYYKR